jgi:lysophospholipase L1-like esterase
MSPRFSTRLSLIAVSAAALIAVFMVQPPQSVQGRSVAIGANGQGTLLIIGDSLTVGTEAFGSLSKKVNALGTWTNVVVDARVGRKASLGATVIQKAITSSTTALVVALGTNDMISKPETWYPRWVIDTVMQKTRGLPVLWVNLEFSQTGRSDWRARGVRFNRELRLAKQRYPNLSIADWNTAFTPQSKSRFIVDGVHLTVSGYKTRSQFLVPAISTFGISVVNASTTTSTSTTTTTSTTILPSTTTSSTTSTTSTTTSTTTTTTTG